jgi:protein-L-isoaspartate(D-aspartate) O-methyltransferase
MDGPRMARLSRWRAFSGVLISFALVPLGGWTCYTGMSESSNSPEDPFTDARRRMVAEQIERRGIKHPDVLTAMRRVPRHRFVPEQFRDRAHDDHPLQIGAGQTISQPYIVAYMTEALRLQPDDRVLEIGTGSGYQAAVLASLVAEVYSIEIIAELGRSAGERLADLGYCNVTVRVGDGYAGWPEKAPFDAIIVTAAPGKVPAPLLRQLKVGGRLVIPVGTADQQLIRWTRTADRFEREPLLPVRFVPMTGEAQRKD